MESAFNRSGVRGSSRGAVKVKCATQFPLRAVFGLTRTKGESKPNHPEQPLQINAPKRIKNGSKANRRRIKSGSKVEKSPQPTANARSQKPKNPKTPEPSGSKSTTREAICL
jgi:hypothetical protein